MQAAGYPVMYLHNTFAFRTLQNQINESVSTTNHGENIKYAKVPSVREIL